MRCGPSSESGEPLTTPAERLHAPSVHVPKNTTTTTATNTRRCCELQTWLQACRRICTESPSVPDCVRSIRTTGASCGAGAVLGTVRAQLPEPVVHCAMTIPNKFTSTLPISAQTLRRLHLPARCPLCVCVCFSWSTPHSLLRFPGLRNSTPTPTSTPTPHFANPSSLHPPSSHSHHLPQPTLSTPCLASSNGHLMTTGAQVSRPAIYIEPRPPLVPIAPRPWPSLPLASR
jgi:hypothetical protein